jgi:putative membrane protein
MDAVSLRVLTFALLVVCTCAAGHVLEGSPTAPLLLRWSFEPWVLACLALSASFYALGVLRLWRRAGIARGIGAMRVASFAVGWFALVAALVSPIDPLGIQLFAAHMLQHELLMVLAAPLLVVGRPLAVWAWALPFKSRRLIGAALHHPAWQVPWTALTRPLAAWFVHAAVLWLWHLPSLFQAALRNEGWHTLQHSSFLVSALLFWWSLLRPSSRSAQGAALLYLFTTMVHTGALGALLTLSPIVWYPDYLMTTAALGIDALEDQQLGGLLMWVPAGFAYLATGLAMAAQWIRGSASPLKAVRSSA